MSYPIPEDLKSRHNYLIDRRNWATQRGVVLDRDGFWMDHEEAEVILIERIARLEADRKALLEALESVEWIMVNGRVQCPSCLSSREEGHHILCLVDEALRPTPEKAAIRADQEKMYADCKARAVIEQARKP